MKTLYRILMLFCSLVILTVGKAYPQNKELIRYDETAFEKAARAVNQEDFNDMEKYALGVFREYVGQKGITLNINEKDHKEATLMIRKLHNECEELRVMIHRYANVQDTLQSQLASEKAINNQLMAEINQLQNELAVANKRLTEALDNGGNTDNTVQDSDLQKYKRAVDEARNTIYGIYNSNLVKPIIEMDPGQLDQASSKFEGMKALLEVDQNLFKDLQNKIDEINAWKALIVPMKDVIQFLKGKYDENKQKKFVAEINSVTLKGSKAAEKDETLQYLADDALLHDNYTKIIRYLEDNGCLPSTETLWSANEMLARMTSNKPFYHPAVYDSYDRGINMLRVELSKSAPSNRVKTAVEFNKFINELKEIF